MAQDPASPEAPEQLLWEGRPHPLYLWLLALGGLAIGLMPLWSLTDPGPCSHDCPGTTSWWLFAVLSGLIGLISLPVVVLLPFGGLKIRYQLTDRRFIIRRSLPGRKSRRDLALAEHSFGAGRGNQIWIRNTTAGRGTVTILFCLTRSSRDALRDALPEGTWQ
ncbi:hypothetical protein [Pseudogemmobacter faecipullorum]|uniref:DUF304 domain-containing protein n=1 Tax=Pseudogemmobacter faecipullorum TaxID=2755041 RepID=A0ABS8CQ86_9RHOB|nr:hypothetical protein [Pseudogemmobacter faecipullorum]MCB5410990.1 hypothetical protein [Pseudogemmobacter faecipullorum]